jgi:hypothetical protein
MKAKRRPNGCDRVAGISTNEQTNTNKQAQMGTNEHCDRSSESSEAVEAVCCCLACFLDRSSRLPVVDHLIITFHLAFLLCSTIPRGDTGGFNLSLLASVFSIFQNREPQTENREL